eukprot:gene8998-biopygen143
MHWAQGLAGQKEKKHYIYMPPSGAPEKAMWGTRSASGVNHIALSAPPLGGQHPQVAFGAAHGAQNVCACSLAIGIRPPATDIE